MSYWKALKELLFGAPLKEQFNELLEKEEAIVEVVKEEVKEEVQEIVTKVKKKATRKKK